MAQVRLKQGQAPSVLLALALLSSCSSKITLGAWQEMVVVSTPVTSAVPSVEPTAPLVDARPPPIQEASVGEPDVMETSTVMPDSGPAPSAVDAAMPLPSQVLPMCGATGTLAPFNKAGAELGASETATDWIWPTPLESMEWAFTVERDVALAAPPEPSSGYYFAQQFWFARGVAGILGLQSNGGYQPDPPGPYTFTKMIAFWLSGPPTAAELGDIAYPNARIAPMTANGSNWLTIHAKFDWQPCHAYKLRFGPESTIASGSVWYGAWLIDTSTDTTTFIGRMLLAADTGQLSPFSTTLTSPIDFGQPSSCGVSEPISVIFGNPTGNDATVSPTSHTNRFTAPMRCPTSRFTELPDAVRHELGVVRPAFP